MEQNFDDFVLDHFRSSCDRMEPDEISDCKGLVSPDLWHEIIPSERRYIFGRPLSRFVKYGLLPMEFVGFNSMRHNLYRKK